MAQTEEKIDGCALRFLLYRPKRVEAPIPLMLFLHGAGERGDDLSAVSKHGIPKRAAQGDDLPFIAVSPQCPAESWWTAHLAELSALLDAVKGRHPVDPDRVYLTGLSMGGYGTWALAAQSPETFAAAAPICGGGDPETAPKLINLPIWAFHGAKDEVVPLERSEAMVDAVKQAGGNVQLTVYPEAGHDSWTETYDNPELYAWFLRHKRV